MADITTVWCWLFDTSYGLSIPVVGAVANAVVECIDADGGSNIGVREGTAIYPACIRYRIPNET